MPKKKKRALLQSPVRRLVSIWATTVTMTPWKVQSPGARTSPARRTTAETAETAEIAETPTNHNERLEVDRRLDHNVHAAADLLLAPVGQSPLATAAEALAADQRFRPRFQSLGQRGARAKVTLSEMCPMREVLQCMLVLCLAYICSATLVLSCCAFAHQRRYVRCRRCQFG